MADRNPRRLSNWTLVCNACGVEFLSSETASVLRDHQNGVHGGGEPRLRLVWVGRGPAPKERPRPPE